VVETQPRRFPTYAISHGGGPWPWLNDVMPVDWTPLEVSLAEIPGELPEPPKAILMVTAHWEASAFTVASHPSPSMIYDYGDFPPETYDIIYPAPGSPSVAVRALDLLSAAGLPAENDPDRGFDHGTFVPAYVMYPDADIPVVQLSIHRSYEPAMHLDAGRALAPLRDEGILIVGSGLPSFHNMSSMGSDGVEPSRVFDAWLTETMVELSGAERSRRLIDWATAPGARLAHPREDHFIPLLVAVGAAESDLGVRHYHEDSMFGQIASSGYRLDTTQTNDLRNGINS
jgi:aromatic ring-opening dioxygenase catalytic subunit (LigB family)